jgi:hypothetical protein
MYKSPFVLSLSKDCPTYNCGEEKQSFDKLRANGFSNGNVIK